MNYPKSSLWMSKEHPQGLYTLFFAAMWDRFSFYGASALLILYLTKIVLFSENNASDFYGSFIALGFAAPVVGGFIADKYLGINRAILWGAFGIFLGNVLLSIPSNHFLYIGFAVLTIGMGLFKGNITGLVGRLYEKNDSRKDNGFIVFYMGMNLGAILGPVVYGICAIKLGWHYGFIFSAIGMLISLLLFRHLQCQQSFCNNQIKTSVLSKKLKVYHPKFFISVTCALIILSVLFYFPFIANKILGIFSLSAFVSLLFIAFWRPTKIERNQIFLLILLSFFSMFYFACSMQTGSSLTLFIEKYMDRHICGINIPTIIFSSIDPFFTIILAPVFIYLWTNLSQRNKEPSAMIKLFLGLVLTSISFLFFALATRKFSLLGNSHPIFWVFAGNMFLGVGELIIFPAISSTFYRYSPPELLGTLMGIWYLSASLSGYFGTFLGKINNFYLINVSDNPYYKTFIVISGITLIISFFALTANLVVKRFKH